MFDPEQAVNVLEHLWLVSREVWRQEAPGMALSSLIFARSAGLASATFEGHFLLLCIKLECEVYGGGGGCGCGGGDEGEKSGKDD